MPSTIYRTVYLILESVAEDLPSVTPVWADAFGKRRLAAVQPQRTVIRRDTTKNFPLVKKVCRDGRIVNNARSVSSGIGT